MKTLQELRDARAEKVKAADAILAKAKEEQRDATDDELSGVETLLEEVRALDSEIETREAAETRALDIAASVDAAKTRTSDLEKRKAPALAIAQPGGIDIEFPRRTRKLVSFRGEDAERRAFISGTWCKAALFGDQRAARWLKDNEQRAMVTYDNTLGGALVPDEFEQTIIDLAEEWGMFRQNARVVNMARDTRIVPRVVGSVTVYAVGEGADITESEMTLDNVQLTARKWAALTKYSSELSEDSAIDIAELLARHIARGLAEKEDDCGWNGDGTSTYHGIRGVKTVLASGLSGYIAAASGHDTFAEIDASDLGLCMGGLPEYPGIDAKWYTSKVGYATVFQRLLAASGGNTQEIVAGRSARSYQGYPIVISQKLPNGTSTLSGQMLYYGDLSMAATMGLRRGMTLKLLNELYAVSDQIGIVATTRWDIVVHDVGTTAAKGPIVALVATG